jgi:hypothetical protein
MTVNVIWRMVNCTPLAVEVHISGGRDGTTTQLEDKRSGSFPSTTFAING